MHDDPQLIFDCHLDLAWNALGYKRDLTLPLAQLNRGERGVTDQRGRGLATTTLPEMRAGGVGLCLATVIARTPVGEAAIHGSLLDYPTPAAAGAVATGQLAWYRALAEAGEMALLATRGELLAHAQRWRAGKEHRVGMVLAMEGSDPIISPDHVARWYAAGLRVASLVHYGLGRYAGGTGTDGELTAAGRALLAAFAEAGLILDVTHLSDAAFYQTLDRFAGPVLASHQNCRALVPGGRQFTDEQLRLVLEPRRDRRRGLRRLDAVPRLGARREQQRAGADDHPRRPRRSHLPACRRRVPGRRRQRPGRRLRLRPDPARADLHRRPAAAGGNPDRARLHR